MTTDVSNQGQYEYVILEDGNRIAGQVIDDPFVTSHIEFHLSRWDAFKAIFKPLVKHYVHRVWGTPASYRVVFQGDYTPPEPIDGRSNVANETWRVKGSQTMARGGVAEMTLDEARGETGLRK